MRPLTQQIIVIGTTAACFIFLPIPFWAKIFLVLPFLIIVFTACFIAYGCRPSLEIEPVPESGYTSRTRSLEVEKEPLQRLGFEWADAFYLATVPDVVVHVYCHREEPAFACLYHFGAQRASDWISLTDGETGLTTGSAVGAGLIPRPKEHMLQIFPKEPNERLWKEHQNALAFLKGRGFLPKRAGPAEIRDKFMKSMRQAASIAKSHPLWLIRLLYWQFSGRGKVHCRSVEEQFRAGFLP